MSMKHNEMRMAFLVTWWQTKSYCLSACQAVVFNLMPYLQVDSSDLTLHLQLAFCRSAERHYEVYITRSMNSYVPKTITFMLFLEHSCSYKELCKPGDNFRFVLSLQAAILHTRCRSSRCRDCFYGIGVSIRHGSLQMKRPKPQPVRKIICALKALRSNTENFGANVLWIYLWLYR